MLPSHSIRGSIPVICCCVCECSPIHVRWKNNVILIDLLQGLGGVNSLNFIVADTLTISI